MRPRRRLAGEIVMFGGHHLAHEPLGDTWTLDGADWTRRPMETKPGARYATAMAEMTSPHQLVLFGGYGERVLGDTWVWGHGAWTGAAPDASSPRASPRSLICTRGST